MLSLPQQSVQQKSESDSFAVLVYKLKALGIFRNVTANDFGIDFEIELINKGSVSGRLIKAQIKSRKSFRKDAAGQVTVNGIAQSTLAYWLSVSKHCPVIVFGVDLATEEIFYSEPIYAQAAALLDGTPASKSVTLFYTILADGTGLDHLRAIALDYGFEAKRLMHQQALLRLKYLANCRNEWLNHNLDVEAEVHDRELFPWLLQTGRALLGYAPLVEYCTANNLDLRRFYEVRYWVERSNQMSKVEEDLLLYIGTRKHVPYMVDLVLEYLCQRRTTMLDHEALYWTEEDPAYLHMVYDYDIALIFATERYTDWCPSFYGKEFSLFLTEVSRRADERLKDYEKAKISRHKPSGDADVDE